MRCKGVPSIEGTLSRSADTCLLFPQLCCTCRVASFRSSYLRAHHYFSWHLSLHHRSLTWGLIRERRNSSRPFPRLKHGLEPVNIFLPFLCVCVWELCAARFCVLVFCLRGRCSPIMPFSLAWQSGRNVISLVISYERLLAVTLKLKQLEMWL